jgi:hypothetical protein
MQETALTADLHIALVRDCLIDCGTGALAETA